MRVNRSCLTCEFNFDGICCGHGDTYKYAEPITDPSLGCEGWGINLEYFKEILKLAPWYIIDEYNKCKITFYELLSLMDKFYNKDPIEVNIYDAIEKICKIDSIELAAMLNVPIGVVGYARRRGTIPRRAVEFSRKLDIPIEYFSKVTNLDLPHIESILLRDGN